MGLWDRLFGRQQDTQARPAAQRISRGRKGPRAEYDGATVGRRAAGWRRTLRDANGELTPAAQAALRGIASDLVRNNPFAARGVSAIAENMIGTGVTFQIYRDGKIDKELNEVARKHLDTNNCDAGGLSNLYGLQLQAARSIVERGGIIMRRRWRRASDRLPLPFQIQVLEPDYLDMSKHGEIGTKPGVAGGYMINGIQFTPLGRREGYWLYSGHPGSPRHASLSSTFIPARDVAHGFRVDRPEQQHGATWLAPVILRMRDFADYEDGELNRQKIASAFVGVVHGEDAEGRVPGIASEADDPDDPGPEDREPLDYVEPGTFQYLRTGEEVTFSNPPSTNGYADYSKVSLHAVSTGLGVPYEIVTGDLSDVSFISGRLGRLDFRRAVSAWQWLMFIPQLCDTVGRWTLEALEISGHDINGVEVRWTPPKTEMLDPATEIPAIRDAIRSGQQTISGAARERGEDPDTFLDEWAADAAELDRRGLIFDSDPRKVTQVGNSVQPTSPVRDTPKGGK